MFDFWRKSTGEISVSPIDTEDLQQCADIHAASFTTAWGDGTLNTMLKSKNMHGLVGKSLNNKTHSNILGFALYSVAASEAEIITIATDPKFRNSGVGKAILDKLIHDCLADRLSEIFLEVDENNAAALKLYRKRGFKKVGERKGYYSEPNSASLAKNSSSSGNALIMRRNLLD